MDVSDNDSRVGNSQEDHLENFVKKPIVIIKLISIVSLDHFYLLVHNQNGLRLPAV